MKIAIQGHPTRGKEVIQILENLGGKNIHELSGNGVDCAHYYHIDNCGVISISPKYDLRNYKFYTLEEFEKEFPFKIGDIVLIKGPNKPYEVIALEWYMDRLCCKLDNQLYYGPQALTTYKEMKQERNITLTLDKAKEWYNKGGDLKQIALQAFSEEELKPLPRSWEEFCNQYYEINDKEHLIDVDSRIAQVNDFIPNHYRLIKTDRNICPSKKSAEAHLAMIQLEQLRNCWWNGWKPIWGISQKWCIRLFNGVPSVGITTNISKFLTFPTKEMAEEFLECFRDLIEQAGDLI